MAISKLTPFAKFRSDFSLSAYKRYYTVVKYAGIIVLILTGISYFFIQAPDPYRSEDHIARIDVGNASAYNAMWVSDLAKAIKNDYAKGIVLVIDQASSSGADLFEIESAMSQIRNMKERKPIVSFVYGYALAGNYVLATGTDYIVAQKTATLGGISIAVSSFDPKPLLDKIGVNIITKGYGDLKVMPDKKDKKYAAFIQHRNSVYENLYKWMLQTVKQNRALDADNIMKISKGQWYLGDRALGYGLCDATGDLISATDRIRTALGDSALPLLDYSHDQHGDLAADDFVGYLSNYLSKNMRIMLRSAAEGISQVISDELRRTIRHTITLHS